jgi:hypothetical protein
LRQLGAKPEPGMVEARLDRARRDSKLVCDRVHRQVSPVSEGEDDPVVELEPIECSQERIAFGDQVGRIACPEGALGRPLELRPEIHNRASTAGADLVAADVDHDAPEPRREPLEVAKPTEPGPGSDGSLVHGILGIGRAAEDHRSQTIAGVEMAIHERSEHIGRRWDGADAIAGRRNGRDDVAAWHTLAPVILV